jgi:hypothetical protein
VNPDEQAADDAIHVILDAAVYDQIGHKTALHMMWRPMETFRPRCPKCRTAVAWTPWQAGLRAAKCGRCSHGWKEAL